MSEHFGRRPELNANLLASEIAISTSAAFMEAAVAAYAIIAHADGEVAAMERRRLMLIARIEPKLKAFSHADVSEEFATHEANYLLDNELAGQLALEKLEALKPHRRDAHIIIDACREAIHADGVTHPSEIRALEKVKRALGF
jgi:tellurite resistance protein